MIRRENVTTLHVVPSMLDALLDDAEGELPGSLRRVLAIGEVLPVDTAERTLEHSDTDLVNLYGPTEAAVSVTAHRVTETAETSVPIGSPIPNTQVFVLDDRLHPVPPGVAGELYLAGAQLARGYLGRPELTSERFVANPFGAPGTRLYRTGDVVRWRFDDDGLSGTLEYLDRADFQVKVRGFRIELGEIESALRALPQVRDAVVTVQNGDRIVAFVVPVAESPDIASIRAALTRTLPSYMVPQASSRSTSCRSTPTVSSTARLFRKRRSPRRRIAPRAAARRRSSPRSTRKCSVPGTAWVSTTTSSESGATRSAP